MNLPSKSICQGSKLTPSDYILQITTLHINFNNTVAGGIYSNRYRARLQVRTHGSDWTGREQKQSTHSSSYIVHAAKLQQQNEFQIKIYALAGHYKIKFVKRDALSTVPNGNNWECKGGRKPVYVIKRLNMSGLILLPLCQYIFWTGIASVPN